MTTLVTKDRWIGAGVRYARTLQGMKLKDLAEQIGRSSAYVSRIENGVEPAKPGDLMAFAHVLDVTVGFLEDPPLPPSMQVIDLGPWCNSDSFPTHNVVDLDAKGKILDGPWGDGPDGGTPAAQPVLPLRKTG